MSAAAIRSSCDPGSIGAGGAVGAGGTYTIVDTGVGMMVGSIVGSGVGSGVGPGVGVATTAAMQACWVIGGRTGEMTVEAGARGKREAGHAGEEGRREECEADP